VVLGLPERYRKLNKFLLNIKAYYYRKVTKKLNKPTTKRCPYCGNDKLANIRSQNKKICYDCCFIKGSRTEINWELEKGQKRLL
jgi:ribosomal protein L32